MKTEIVLSCEHASNKIPPEYANIFKATDLLNTHRGYDIGAMQVIKILSRNLKIQFHHGQYSRLLIDLNRNLKSKTLFSEYTNLLDNNEKERILFKYYNSYVENLDHDISDKIKRNKFVLHLSIHSFTPFFNNQNRDLHMGLLYDPSRKMEKEFSHKLKEEVLKHDKEYNIRYNYPYKGISDSLVKKFRKLYTSDQYAGIEIEFNQKLFDKNKIINKKLINIFNDSLFTIIGKLFNYRVIS